VSVKCCDCASCDLLAYVVSRVLMNSVFAYVVSRVLMNSVFSDNMFL